MSEQTGGDPLQVSEVQVIAPGETTAKEPVTVAEPPKAEETTKEGVSVEPEKPDPAKEYKKKADDAHKQVIDLIEDKFKLLEDNRLEDKELRKWFLDHKEFADSANRSKRMKDKYRALMERSPEVRSGDKKVEQIPEKDVVDDTKEETKIPTGDRPLTASDLQKALDERDERLLERSLIQERQSRAEEFAQKNNILDDDYKALIRNADALLKANEEWTYTQALEAAKAVIRTPKDKPMNVVTNDSIRGSREGPKEKVDLTKATPLSTWEEFSGQKRK
jgi:hypothetical protein